MNVGNGNLTVLMVGPFTQRGRYDWVDGSREKYNIFDNL